MDRKNLLSRRLFLWALSSAAMSSHATSTGFASNFEGMHLRDQDNRPFKLQALDGRVLLVNFVYTACSTACPLQTRALAQVQANVPFSLLTKIHFLSVSLDPLSDTPSVLKAYALRMGVDLSNWSFLTGRPVDISLLSERLRLLKRPMRSADPDNHSTSLWLSDARGRLVQRYGGNPPDVRRVTRELLVIANMAGQHSLGETG